MVYTFIPDLSLTNRVVLDLKRTDTPRITEFHSTAVYFPTLPSKRGTNLEIGGCFSTFSAIARSLAGTTLKKAVS